MAGKRTTRHDPTSHLRAASARWGGTLYKSAPTKSVSVGGTRFVYRELGIDSGVPVIFVNHLAANLDNWDPRVVDGIAAKHRVITFDNRGVGASGGDVLEEYANKNPEFGQALMRAIIGLVGDRVRAIRLQLIARRYHDDVTAIRQLLRDSDDVLPLFSPLHKLPHYLENRLTLDDAFHMLDVVRVRGDPVERPVAEVCVDILGNVRRELQLYQQLQAIYSSAADAPADMDPEIVRRRSLVEFQKLFAYTTHRILGERLLPERSGHIFIMNHLKNHPDNLLPNNFILTLDTHFVASMILLKKYGDAPIRVVRKAQPDEYGHQKFYDRLGYIYTYTGYVDPDPADPAATPEVRRRFFFDAAAGYLRRGQNILICPEGTSTSTEESPVRFRPGAFELTSHVSPEPLIVPIAVANFDKKITRTITAAVLNPPFLLSSYVDPADHQALLKFINHEFTPRFRTWVREAVHVAAG